MILKKDNTNKTSSEISNDIINAFTTLIKQNDREKSIKMLSITITDTIAKHNKDLRHLLTNSLFNSIHKDYKNTLEVINYLFVIEYPEIISKGKLLPNNCNVHSHIVLNTTLSKDVIEYYIQQSTKGDVYIEDISKRKDRNNYVNYLVKQSNLFTNDNYNYKITMN
jgi:hypothetical protein